jgi:hypothetical protein
LTAAVAHPGRSARAPHAYDEDLFLLPYSRARSFWHLGCSSHD